MSKKNLRSGRSHRDIVVSNCFEILASVTHEDGIPSLLGHCNNTSYCQPVMGKDRKCKLDVGYGFLNYSLPSYGFIA